MIAQVKTFWSEMGWFANLLTIILSFVTLRTIIYNVYSKIRKFIITDRFYYSDFGSLISEKVNNWDPESLKSKKICIVDDNPENYPITYLKDSGFNIHDIQSLSLAEMDNLLKYDLLILDITGIVKEDPEQGGLELLRRLKEKDKDLLTIAASSKRFDPTLTEFFKLSDAQIKTPIEGVELEKKLLDILNLNFCPNRIAKHLDDITSGKQLDQKQKKNLLKISCKYIDKKISKQIFLQRTSNLSHLIDTRTLQHQLSILQEIL